MMQLSRRRNGLPERRNISVRRLLLRIFAWCAGTLATLAILSLVLLIILVNLVNVNGVHRYLLSLLQAEVTAKLGVAVTVENFRLHVPTLSMDLYGIKIDGAPPCSTPPFLQIKHLEVSARIESIFRRKWYLESIEIDDPVIWIFKDAHGVSNIPKLRSNSSSANINIFDLAIRRAALVNGTIYFDSRPQSLDANLSNLAIRANYNKAQHAYIGALDYNDGRLKFGGSPVLPHGLKANYTITLQTFHLERALLTSGGSRLNVSATIRNTTPLAVNSKYNAVVDIAQASRLLANSSVHAMGSVHVSGTLLYRNVQNRPYIDNLAIHGNAVSGELSVTTKTGNVMFRRLVTEYSLSNGNARLNNLMAYVLGGKLLAGGFISQVGANARANMSFKLQGASLSSIQQSFFGRESFRHALRGTMGATASASWKGTLKNLVVHVDAKIGALLAQNRTPPTLASIHPDAQATQDNFSSAFISVQSAIHATYVRATGRFEVSHSYVKMPQTNLTLNGILSDRSYLALRLQANDLQEIGDIANLFVSSHSADRFWPLKLTGTATFQGSVSGPLDAPHVRGDLTASAFSLDGSRWKTVRMNIDLRPSQLRLQNVNLEPASQGRIVLDATAALHKWTFNGMEPVDVSLKASQISLGDIAKMTGRSMAVTGNLDAKVQLHGNVLTPEGSGDVILIGATIYEQPVKSVNINLLAHSGEVHGKLLARVAGGTVMGTATVWPHQRTFTAQLSSPGISLNHFKFLKSEDLKCSGVLSVHASSQGPFQNPKMTAGVTISKLMIQNHNFSQFKLDMQVANHIAAATLFSEADGAPISAHGTVHLTGDYLADVALDTKTIPLQPFIATYSPDISGHLSGQTEVHATLHGPLKDVRLLEGHVTIPLFSLAYDSKIKLAASSPIQIDYKEGVIALRPALIRGADTEMRVQGSIPMFGSRPATLQALGSVDLRMARLFDPELQASGLLKFNVHSNETSSVAGLSGEIDVLNANLSTPSSPVGMQNGNGVLILAGNRIDISRFQGIVGGGTITARGGISLQPKTEFDLGMAAKDVRILYPQGVREEVGANLRFTGSSAHSLLSGTVDISDASFTPGFDLTSLISQFSSGIATPTAPGFKQSVALNITVRSTSNLNLASRTLSVAGSANLFMRGTAAHPAILGRVNLTGGNIILNGNRFALTGGTVQFVNPSETQPVVNLTLSTTIQQYNIDLRFTGPIERMRREYTSNPALPRADIISLLAFGKTTEANATNATPANQAAESLIASQVSSQVTGRISKIAGISQLSISPVLANSNNQGPPGAVITIRQQVSGNLYITFSTNVASTQGETIQGEYRLSPRVAVSATRNPNGGFAVDTLIKRSW